jgi:hypothetical protein
VFLADDNLRDLAVWMSDGEGVALGPIRGRVIVQLALVGFHRAVLSVHQLEGNVGVVLPGNAGNLIVEAGVRVDPERRQRHDLLPCCGVML